LLFKQLQYRRKAENSAGDGADDYGSILEAQNRDPEVLPNFLLRKLYTDAKRAAA
jgi:hypothetical protein